MSLRAKLLAAIAALTGVQFLLLALLVEAEHLRNAQERRIERREQAQRMLEGCADPGAWPIVLGAMTRGGLLARWAVEHPGGAMRFAGDRALMGRTDAALLCLERAVPGGMARVVAEPAQEAVDPLPVPFSGLLGATLIGAFLLTAMIGLMLDRLVTAPLAEAALAAGRIAAGDPGAAMRFQTRGDEIGRLARAFNAMARDVREVRGSLESRVREATAEVERTQRGLAFAERLAATGRLAAGVAHEINNPLGGVMNAVGRLRSGALAPERREEYFALVEDGLGRIRDIVRRILDFARRRPEVVAGLDLRDPLRAALGLCRHRIETKGIRLEEALDASAPVRGDAGELQQVFLNLLTNALDALPEGGRLRVCVGAEGGRSWGEVADEGAGMTPEELAASAEMFYTTKPAGEGTGLGLSIAHEIAARHGGALEIESRKGEGTRARLSLPAGPGETA